MHFIPFEVNSSNHLKLIEFKYSLLFAGKISFEYLDKHVLIIKTPLFRCKMFFTLQNSVGLHIATSKPSNTFIPEFANILRPLLKNFSIVPIEYGRYECEPYHNISRTVDGVISKKTFGWHLLVADVITSASISNPADYDSFIIVSIFDFFLTSFHQAHQAFISGNEITK